jgi:hypothetical protein
MVELSSGLLIRGFGVRVPGGAPVLTWVYTHSRWPREGRFRPMFAPCLLACRDLVARASLRAPRDLYRFRTRRKCCDLRFGRMSRLRQDRGLCPFACST